MGKWQVLAQRVLHAFHIRADVFRGGGAVGENHVGVGHEHHRDDDILAQSKILSVVTPPCKARRLAPLDDRPLGGRVREREA